MTQPSRPIRDAPIPEDMIERMEAARRDHCLREGRPWVRLANDQWQVALTASGLPARVAELEAALGDCRAAHAQPRTWPDPQPVFQESTDDCLRACICTVTGLAPALFADYATKDWPAYWKPRLARYGHALVDADPRYLSAFFDGAWIGLPPSLHDDGAHAVVMRGRRLVHDPGRRKPSYNQERIDAWLGGSGSALIVVPLGPAVLNVKGAE